MSWTTQHGLATRIGTASIPLVLCGPMLRHVEPGHVSVFVALKVAREVTLRVFEGLAMPAQLKLEGTANTVRVGQHLHVAVVTAMPAAGGSTLHSGQIYGYDLRFERKGTADPGDTLPSVSSLGDLGLLSEPHLLGYDPGTLPSFALPPASLADLRIIHGSCRKPHGESDDALEALDAMIANSRSDPNDRPHQLFLTGDQIYADDVSDALLMMLIDAGDTLLGWQELPIGRNSDGTYPRQGTVTPKGLSNLSIPVDDLLPGRRSRTARKLCGFTACPPGDDDCTVDRSHLIALGEYIAMYLFAWCDALWPSVLPGSSDMDFLPSADVKEAAAKQTARVRVFRSTLRKARRALANVPTYMMFDDHEITDDWFLNRYWCARVLDKALGRRAIQNGLIAFAIFQAWGNTPERFTILPPGDQIGGIIGEQFLQAIAAWSASGGTNQTARTTLNRVVSVPEDVLTSIQGFRRLSHDAGTLDWHYRLTGPRHEVVVLDTRTWRAYPGVSYDFPVLISDEGFVRQVVTLGESQAEVMLVISPVPVVGVTLVESQQESAVTAEQRLSRDTEGWKFQPKAYEMLLSALAQRLPTATAGGMRRGRIVLLSGDVHYGYAARLQYWGERPFGSTRTFDTSTRGDAEMVVAQFTSSSLKNETSHGLASTHQLHGMGFEPGMDALPPPLLFLGWNNHGGPARQVGTFEPGGYEWFIDQHPAVDQLAPLAPRRRSLDGTSTHRPHWRYRIDFILSENEVTDPASSIPRGFSPRSVPVPPPGPDSSAQRKEALAAYLAMSANHRDYARRWGNGKEIVGVNNIGEIHFEWGSGDDKRVVQELWWRLEQLGSPNNLLPPFPLSKAIVALGFSDSRYPQPSA